MSLCPHLCLLAFRAPFENIMAPKRGRNAHFQKSLKVPLNGVIKTLFTKNQVWKSIGVTRSTYRRFTKDKVENIRKWLKRAKNTNFENHIDFLMSQGVLCQKITLLGQKLSPAAREHTDRGFNDWVPYQSFSLSSFCLWYERSNNRLIRESQLSTSGSECK